MTCLVEADVAAVAQYYLVRRHRGSLLAESTHHFVLKLIEHVLK